MMNRHYCRMCARLLPQERLLYFRNMPRSAQFLPDAQALQQDTGIDLEVYQCTGCGLVQISNEPVPYYREVVRAAAFSTEMQEFRRKQFAAFVCNHGLQGKRLLEVGCGRGEYLSLLQEAGVTAYGLEYAEASVQHCISHGLQVSRGYINHPEYTLANAPFDAFAVLNFLEHWPDPNASLSGIAHNLSADGIGLVEVPNFDMMLRKNLFTEFISDHIFYFTRETLENLLRLNGFEVLECSEVWHGYILSAVVRKRRPNAVATFEHSRQRLKRRVDDFIHKKGERGVAIWGAGHQALAAIVLLELGSAIRYVIDSAPFKQGRYTPSSHLPIVAPEKLDSDPVDAIIVMAASYSDEVAKLIRSRWGNQFEITIMRDDGLEQA